MKKTTTIFVTITVIVTIAASLFSCSKTYTPAELSDTIRTKTGYPVKISCSASESPTLKMEGWASIDGMDTIVKLHNESEMARMECSGKEFCSTLGAWSIQPSYENIVAYKDPQNMSGHEKGRWGLISKRLSE